MKHLQAIALSSLIALVSAGSAHAQSLQEQVMNEAVAECRMYQDYGDHVFIPSRPGNATIDVYEMVETPDQMIDCIDATDASLTAYGRAIAVKLTVREAVNVNDYANNHFPSRFMTHTYEQWREAFSHRDEKQPSYNDYVSGVR